MTHVVLVGGGGHAMSCLDACDPAQLDVIGYVAPAADPYLPLPYLGDDEELGAIRRSGVRHAFVALGDNALRRSVTARAIESGFQMASVVAPTARVSPHALLAPGAAVLHGALVGPRARIGAGAIVNTGASVDHDCSIGDFAHIAPGSHLAGCVRIGTGAFTGVGVSVIPDVTVGEWAIVGAGAVVVDDLPPAITAVGAPARARRVS